MFSNKENHFFIDGFLQGLKEVVGEIDAKVIMTDDYSVYFNSWLKIFGGNPIKLLCSWHVIRNIRKNIKKFISNDKKIFTNASSKNDKKKVLSNQNVVMKKFLSLRNELDVATFNKKLNAFVEFIKKFERFHKYFSSYYLNRTKEWAYCFRKYLKINVNMGQENYHLVLKKNYFKFKKTFRLDKGIYLILKHLDYKLKSRNETLSTGKKNKRTALSYKNHKTVKENYEEFEIEERDSLYVVAK